MRLPEDAEGLSPQTNVQPTP